MEVTPRGYADIDPDEVKDFYAGTDVPGEFRCLTDALACEQLAVTLIRVPAHSDFEQRTGHFHDEPVELWAVSRRLDRRDSTKIEDFWEPSPDADQRRG
jgi:hypothetical protein